MSKRDFLDIEKAFLSNGTVHGSILHLDSTSALRLIEMAKKKNIEVLGVDSFQLSETSTKPLMDHILDLSLKDDGIKNSWEIASDFIKQRSDKDFQFEVVLKK